MATILAPVDQREVVRCDRCQLVQFRTNSGLCRKCHTSLDPEDIPILAPEPQPEAATATTANGGLRIATAIRNLRERAGLSQRQLALRMNVPRTYVSKIENDKATPTLSSLERLANALEVSVPELLKGAEPDVVGELCSDPFIVELIPYLQRLNMVQWQNVMGQMRELSTRTRRTI